MSWYLQLNLSMSELSLDIVLFVIGQLNLAGPYAVRSSSILANCCKVCHTISESFWSMYILNKTLFVEDQMYHSQYYALHYSGGIIDSIIDSLQIAD